MPTLETLTEKEIKQVVKASSLKKARGYVARVNQAVRHGRSLRANVKGSRTYTVEIDVDENGIQAVCSCPYDWGGYCKHIAAVLLLWLEMPDSFVIERAAPAPAPALIETFAIQPPTTAVPKQKPPWLIAPYASRLWEYEQAWQNWLHQLYKVQELRQMAKQQGWAISGTRKDDIIQQITRQLTQPGILLKSLHKLNNEHRQVYDALATLHPTIPYRQEHLTALAQQWGALTQYEKTDVYVQNLIKNGLAIPGNVVYTYPPHLAFVVPSVRRALPPLLADRLPEADLPAHTESGLQLGQPRPFLQRLQQILLLLEQSRPPLRPPMPRPRQEKFHEILQEWDYLPEEIKQAQQANKLHTYDPKFNLTVPPPPPPLPDDSLARLAPLAGDETRATFIYNLLLAAGLLQPGSPVTVWPEMKEQFLKQDEAAQWAILARTYFFTTMAWSEMWLMVAERPSLQLKRGRSRYYQIQKPKDMYNLLTLFRGQALQLLADLPDDRWFSLRDVCDLLHPIWPRFDAWSWNPMPFSGDARPDWFLAEGERPLDTAANKADWNMAQGAFIQQMIQGPLHWLGLADISLEYGKLVAFRLHGLGDLYFDRVDTVPLTEMGSGKAETAVSPPAAADAVTIQDDLITVLPTAVSAQTHNYLDNLAKLEEALPNRFIYRLSGAAVHQNFENGKTLAQLLKGWQEYLPLPMPAAMQQQLSAWWEAYGQVRLYEKVTVIEFGDEYALAEMKAATSLEKYLVAEISPGLIIIPAEAVDSLVAELEKAGYTPKQTDKVE